MTLTTQRVWAYIRPANDTESLIPAPLLYPPECEVVDLVTDREKDARDWWIGTVVCLGRCQNHIFAAMVEGGTPPRRIICPGCKLRSAIPEPYWGAAFEALCPCGRRFRRFEISVLPRSIQCTGCGSLISKLTPWPHRN